MMHDPRPSVPGSFTTDEAWQHIEAQLDEIAELARSQQSVVQFHQELLERLLRLLAAAGGAIWVREASGGWKAECQIRLESIFLGLEPSAEVRHAGLLQQVVRTGQARSIPPHAGDEHAGNSTPWLIVLAPLAVAAEVVGIVEVILHSDLHGAVQPGYQRVVTAACALANDFHRDRRLLEVAARESLWQQYRGVLAVIHRSFSLPATAYALANEGRRFLACDRLSVLESDGPVCRVLAISGVDVVHRRANVVRALERLASVVLLGREPVWHAGAAESLAPEIAGAFDAYVDESHARYVAVIPLVHARGLAERETPTMVGSLVIESFGQPFVDDVRTRLDLICGHASAALSNALEYERTPLLPVLRWVGRARWYVQLARLPKTLAVLGLLLFVLLALWLIPAEFNISARGELQPERRYEVFAPYDGIVVSLPSAGRERVQRGDTLAVLKSPALELQFSEIVGRKLTVEQRLNAVAAARMRGAEVLAPADEISLSAQEQQLREELSALERQHEILTQQQQQLTVSSPASGWVLTWDIERLLAQRPVKRGEQLMTVADVEGAWQIELRIDDREAGHVVNARQTHRPDLDVSFVLAGNPGQRFAGRLHEFGTATEVDDAGLSFVSATVDLGAVQNGQFRPGATVVARIRCGRRPVGYVWFRTLLEAVQGWLLL